MLPNLTSAQKKRFSEMRAAMPSRPIRPLHGYFQVRNEVLAEFKKDNVSRPNKRFQQFWNDLEEREKNKIYIEWQKQEKKWRKDYDKWLAEHGFTEEEVVLYLREEKRAKTREKGRGMGMGKVEKGESEEKRERDREKKESEKEKRRERKERREKSRGEEQRRRSSPKERKRGVSERKRDKS